MIVAIDGPAAAGKGTLASRLATALGYAHLDTGALYRTVALRLLRSGGDVADSQAAAVAAAQEIVAEDLDDPELRADKTAQIAAQIAAYPAVRAALLDYQRRFAAHPPHGAAGAVIEGRDIGTVVCPHAERKIFVVASLEVRAQRRYRELAGRGAAVDAAVVLDDMRARDAQDRERQASPLVAADDAYLLDTSNLDIDSAFTAARDYVLGGGRRPAQE